MSSPGRAPSKISECSSIFVHFRNTDYNQAKTNYNQAKTKYNQVQPSKTKDNQVQPSRNEAETRQEPSTTKYNQVQPSKNQVHTKQKPSTTNQNQVRPSTTKYNQVQPSMLTDAHRRSHMLTHPPGPRWPTCTRILVHAHTPPHVFTRART